MEVKQMDYEKFYGKLWKTGDTLVITIPANIVKGCGYKPGDVMKVMLKKDDFIAADAIN